MIDLHTHTYYSDACYSPEALITKAAQMQIQTIAITDHDNIEGSIKAYPIAKKFNIELIPAVEMTTRWNDRTDVDVLGYFIDFKHDDFNHMVTRAMDDLAERAK